MKKELSLLLFLSCCFIEREICSKAATAQVAAGSTTNTTVENNGDRF